jgi:hypothetical protein
LICYLTVLLVFNTSVFKANIREKKNFLCNFSSDFSLLVFVLAALCWTKSLSCTVTDFTRMPYQFKVFKYSEFISLIWKGPYYDKISVTSVKKEFPNSNKTLQSLQLSKSPIQSLLSKRPSETPGHSSVSNINNHAFNQGFNQFSKVFFRDMFLEDSAQIPSQRNRIPCIRPDDVIFCPDAPLSKHHPFGRPELSIGTSSVSRSFKLLQLASVWTFQQLVQTPLSVRSSYEISFQNTDMGRQLKPSGRCGCPSGRAHP